MKDLILKIFFLSIIAFSIIWGIGTVSYPSIYQEEVQANSLENAKNIAKFLGGSPGGIMCTEIMVDITSFLCYLKTEKKVFKLSCSYRKNKTCEIMKDIY